jgi:hypothetical protein
MDGRFPHSRYCAERAGDVPSVPIIPADIVRIFLTGVAAQLKYSE